MSIIFHFEKIVTLAKKKGLNKKFYKSAREHLDAVGEIFKTSPTQSAIFAMLIENFGDSVSIEKIAKILKCRKIKLIKYMDDFEALRKLKLIRAKRAPSFIRDIECGFPDFTVPLDVLYAVRKGNEYKYSAYNNLSPEEFFECIYDLLEATKNREIDFEELSEEIEYIFSQNNDIAYVKKQGEYKLGITSYIILLIFFCEMLYNDKEVIELKNIKTIFRTSAEMRMIESRFESQKHKLFVNELVNNDCQDGFADEKKYRLTQKAIDEFLSDVDIKKRLKRRGKNFIQSDKIVIKKLYYNKKIKDKISDLSDLLLEKNFINIQKRLVENGMRTGFACLFSGPPGTGKTETAYQIARETSRDIMLVDAAEIKSMWYGESEKRIKALFDRYRGIVKTNSVTPILLFNEADAVFGKRRELSKSRNGPDQTENTIQNIILQEMENLNGILIATTNMTENFDKAFERRFLYKIEFDKPDIESKKLMWQNQIPALSEEEVEKLAVKFDFSGGQIENIARKSTVSFILKGSNPNLSILENFCEEEFLDKAVKPLGFCS